MDDKQRIALVETRTLDTVGPGPSAATARSATSSATTLVQPASSWMTQAQIISYEEYSPYGSSTYQAVRSQTETAKRYRYTGKERDEESGLYYNFARYYVPWLARWCTCDPASTVDGTCLYRYARNSPVLLTDANGQTPRPASGVEPPPPPPSKPALPEAGAHPQAVLAHSPYGKFWDQALIERYGGKNPAEAMANYQAKLATTTDKKAFGVAEYKAVYGVFRRLVAADPQASQASWEGTQLHHIEAKAADPVPESRTRGRPQQPSVHAGKRQNPRHVAQRGDGGPNRYTPEC